MALPQRRPGLGLLPAQFNLSALRTPMGAMRRPGPGPVRPMMAPSGGKDPLAGLIQQATSRFRGGTPLAARGRGPEAQAFPGLADGQGTVGGPASTPSMIPPWGQGPPAPAARLGVRPPGEAPHVRGEMPEGPSEAQQALGLAQLISWLTGTGAKLADLPGLAGAAGAVGGPLGLAKGSLGLAAGNTRQGAIDIVRSVPSLARTASQLMGPSAGGSFGGMSPDAAQAAGLLGGGAGAWSSLLPYLGLATGIGLGGAQGGAPGAVQAGVLGSAPLLASMAGMGALGATGVGAAMAIPVLLQQLFGGGSSAVGREAQKDIASAQRIHGEVRASLMQRLTELGPRLKTQGDVDFLADELTATVGERIHDQPAYLGQRSYPVPASWGITQFLAQLRSQLPEGPITGLEPERQAQEQSFAGLHEQAAAARQAPGTGIIPGLGLYLGTGEAGEIISPGIRDPSQLQPWISG